MARTTSNTSTSVASPPNEPRLGVALINVAMRMEGQPPAQQGWLVDREDRGTADPFGVRGALSHAAPVRGGAVWFAGSGCMRRPPTQMAPSLWQATVGDLLPSGAR